MMNKVFLMGRLTKELDLKSGKDKSYLRNNLAVDRRGEGTDFINLVFFGKTAETVDKYCHKGSKILIEGHIQTGSYEKDGKKVYTTDVIVDSFDFAESKGAESKGESSSEAASGDEFMNVPVDDPDLPFN